YAIRQEGKNIFLDFNTASLRKKTPVVSPIAKNKQKKKAVLVNKEDEVKTTEEAAASGDEVKQVESDKLMEVIPKSNTDRLISLDFQDADIRWYLGRHAGPSLDSGPR
nr:hypothetical protein [Bacteroidales bacterium]